jgi:hypothetical protein
MASRRGRDAGQGSEAVVGQFKIEMEIGKGSFATVYKAIHQVRRIVVCRCQFVSFLLGIVATHCNAGRNKSDGSLGGAKHSDVAPGGCCPSFGDVSRL